MLTANQPWDLNTINDDMEGQVIYPDKEDVMGDDMRAYVFQACNSTDSGEVIHDQQASTILEYINLISKSQARNVATNLDTDYSKYQANLGWAPIDRVKTIFQNTTQMATESTQFPMQRHFKSR